MIGVNSMNDLFLFYWLGWLLILITYFFIERNKYFYLSVLFIVMSSFKIYITWFDSLTMNLAFLCLLISSFFYYGKLPFSMKRNFISFTILFGYVALLFWKKIAPVWFVVDPMISIPFIISLLVIGLYKGLENQIAIVSLSLTIGQLLFIIILNSYYLYENLAERSFFIMFFIQILLLIVSHAITYIYQFLKVKLFT